MRPLLQNLPLFTFCVTLFTACCTLPGDGLFFVTGKLSEKPKDCSIHLQLESGEIVPYSKMSISEQEFSADFTVAPCPETYEVIVSCNKIIRKRLIIRYGNEVKAGKGVHLGQIPH